MQHRAGFYEKYIKRLLDIVLSGAALVILSPLLLITAVLVRIKLGSPVIFTQERPGKDEKVFKLHKFRSMTDARDASGNLLPDKERLTRFGAKLRSLSIDELPELWDIFRGKMSIVGPRPLLVEYLPYRAQIDMDIFKIGDEYYISEVNPRFGGGYPHAYECGVRTPQMIVNNLNGVKNNASIGLYKSGAVMMKYNSVIIREIEC